MFAKLFAQIFDSSIAEDYNCRRMFMDLLVLADSDGVVDMTQEAIARRTNVPIEQVVRYIAELQQPDPQSRSKVEQGCRLIPIDPGRGWGWRIVNYHHYRKIRDEETRRSYFRDAKRKQRKRVTKNVKDKGVDTGGLARNVTSTSTSSSACSSSKKGSPEGKGNPTQGEGGADEDQALEKVREFARSELIKVDDADWFFWKGKGNGWTNNGKPMKDWKATLRSWNKAGYLPSQKIRAVGGGKFIQPDPKQTKLDAEYDAALVRIAEKERNGK